MNLSYERLPDRRAVPERLPRRQRIGQRVPFFAYSAMASMLDLSMNAGPVRRAGRRRWCCGC